MYYILRYSLTGLLKFIILISEYPQSAILSEIKKEFSTTQENIFIVSLNTLYTRINTNEKISIKKEEPKYKKIFSK